MHWSIRTKSAQRKQTRPGSRPSVRWSSPAKAGTRYFPLEFTNLSTHTCSLDGFPGVSAVNDSGRQLGDPALWSRTSTPHTVLLAPGATAHAFLGYVDAEVSTAPGCKPEPAVQLKIYPPGQRSATYTFFPAEACSAPRHTYLVVQPILPGVGRRGGA